MLHFILYPLNIHTSKSDLLHVTAPHINRATGTALCGDVWLTCMHQLYVHSLPPCIYTFFILSFHPSFPVVILFHNLSCCNDRLRQRALCWCLWAEPLRGWDKVKLTCGFSCVTASFETVSGKKKKKGKKEGKACSSRGGTSLHSSWHAAAGFCLGLLHLTSHRREEIAYLPLLSETYNGHPQTPSNPALKTCWFDKPDISERCPNCCY